MKNFIQTLIGRIERMKIRIEPAKHLLEAAQHLRRERDRERELVLQKSQEAEAYEAVEVFEKKWQNNFCLSR